MDPSTVLRALSELAPAGPRRDQTLDPTGGRALLWLADPGHVRQGQAASRLAARDLLHRDERLLRRGWGFVLGTVEVDGSSRPVRLPLLSEPVRMRPHRRGFTVVPAGDLELTPLVTDREAAARLELVAGLDQPGWQDQPEVVDWLRDVLAAAGLAVTAIHRPAPRKGRTALWPPQPPETGLAAFIATALYLARDVFSGAVADTLLHWSGRPGLADTALAAVYGGGPDNPPAGSPGPARLLSPLPLNPAQAEVVRRARTEPVVVVSGPPGSGKSHAVVAAALDTVDRGGSVLLATQSTHAADVLGELLERYPGPTPVLFGDAERRERIAADLAAGAGTGRDSAALRAGRAAVAAAAARVQQLDAAVAAALDLERRAAGLSEWEPLLPALRAEAPRAFDVGTDLARVAGLAQTAGLVGAAGLGETADPAAVPDGWWARLRARWAGRRLRSALGAGRQVPPARLLAAIEAGRSSQAAAHLAATGGTDLTAAWAALHKAEAALATAVGTAMADRAGSAQRWTRDARASVAGLASALRAGRNRRRELLAGMDGAALVRALPLWVGTAADTGELLPPVAGLFDLVILDEASHLDQMRAAPVLARARRALIVGDPRQLRFVSFVADVDVAATLHKHGLDDRVDIRRVSAYDLAAGAAPVTWLEEHHRSLPHLIEFSARRFYSGRVAVATRHPANDSQDVIDVVRVSGAVVRRGVNAAEVSAAVWAVRQLAGQGRQGIAVVTPFRAQAEALESALLQEFQVDEMARLGLRVGTVHGFQGSESRVVVASLGLVDGDAAGRVRFVADPHLFNVLITRARDRMVVITSLTEPDGLIGDYLAFGDQGPVRPGEQGGSGSADGWTAALAGELRRGGLDVREAYPVGRWTVDLCVGDGRGAVGLITGVHPEGTAAHRERQRTLQRAGWRLRDAFASRWGADPVRAALELTAPGADLPSAPLSSTGAPPSPPGIP